MEQRVRVNDGTGVALRRVPIPHLQVNATTLGAANTLYTVRDDVIFEVGKLAVSNTSGTAATLSLHTVPQGSSATVGNTELSNYSIPANTSVDLTKIIGGLYAGGTNFEAFSGTASVLVVHGWGEEIL